MESEIHVLLDIEAEKSRTLNSLESQLRNTEADERTLHEKLATLTENFGRLEEHICTMKERLIATDVRNEQLEHQLHGA
jgi:septal ring factor EnvC (AmiA/AmiB activator)